MQYITFPSTATGYVYAILRDLNCIPPHMYLVDRLVPPIPGNKSAIKLNNEELTINAIMRIKQAGYPVVLDVLQSGDTSGIGVGGGGGGGGAQTVSVWDGGASEWDGGATTWKG